MAFESARGIHLERTPESTAEIDALVALVGRRSGIAGVVDDLNRQGRNARVPGLAVDHGFAWDPADTTNRRWWPQGISSTADADDSEQVEGRQLLAVSWYAREVRGVKQGSRVTFIDLRTLRYRHVLLVVPVLIDGHVELKPLAVHAGGIVWRGPYLHVAATGRGLLTARVDDILRIPADLHDPDQEALGCRGGSRGGSRGDRLATYGYRHILPMRFAYRAGQDKGVERMRYSFASLARSGDDSLLVAGEYGLRDQTTRLAGYRLDPQTQHLCADEDGRARPVLLEDRGAKSMQGAALVQHTWYVTASRTPYGLGALFTGSPGALKSRRMALPFGPEDITYWPSKDTLWSVSEHPHRRWVYAMNRAQFR